MTLAAIFMGVPFLAYLLLAALPRGRVAAGGIGLGAVLTALAWWAQARGGADAATAGMSQALVVLTGGAVALAGVAQALRMVLAGLRRPRWAYPLIAVLVFLVAALPVTQLLGM